MADSAHSPMAFQYFPIRSDLREIRLLTIHPAAEPNDPIICSLDSAYLDPSVPPFEAVSYAWGDPTLSHSVTFYPAARLYGLGRKLELPPQR